MFWKTDDLMAEDTAASDTETLQTDIQRFIAILGFCLMAIFALVQSISVTAARERTEIEDLSQKIVSQQSDLQSLAQENSRLRVQLADLRPYADASESMRRNLTLIQKQLKRQDIDVKSLLGLKLEQENDILKLKHAIQDRDYQIRRLAREKAETEKLLAAAHTRLIDSNRLKLEIEGLKTRLAHTRTAEEELAKAREEKQRMERLLAAARQVRRPAPAPKAAPRAAAPRRGRYVAFESDRVFMNLLATDRISLFIKVAGVEKWFRARNTDPGITFSAAVPEAAMDPWEVGEDLVPAEIIAAFKNWTSLAPRTEMLVVGLPPEISGAIRSRGSDHGRFIIDNSGGVVFNRFED